MAGTALPAALWLLTLLFGLRVAGQALVAFFGVSFLPPMAQWQSGLLPYPALLLSQILILALQTGINTAVARGSGAFFTKNPIAGRTAVRFSLVYFAAMAARYVLTMAWYPERRWFGHTIPIVFHWVLAAYLFLVGRFAMRAGSSGIRV